MARWISYRQAGMIVNALHGRDRYGRKLRKYTKTQQTTEITNKHKDSSGSSFLGFILSFIILVALGIPFKIALLCYLVIFVIYLAYNPTKVATKVDTNKDLIDREKLEAEFLKLIDQFKAEATNEIMSKAQTTDVINQLDEWQIVRLKRQHKNEVAQLVRQKMRLSNPYQTLVEQLGEKLPNVL